MKNQLLQRFDYILDTLKPNQSLTSHDFSWYIATFLDPFFKNKWLELADITNEEETLFIKRLADELRKEFLSINQSQRSSQATQSTQNEQIENRREGNGSKNRRPLSAISNDSEVNEIS